MPLELSEARRPLFVTTLTGSVTDEEYASYLTHCSKVFFSGPSAYVLLFDALGGISLGPQGRELQSAWLNCHRHEVRARCRGVAFVLASSLHRGILAAAHLVSPPVYPYRIFSQRAEAEAWCMAQLGEVGQPPASASARAGASSRVKERSLAPTSEASAWNSLHPIRSASSPGGYSLKATQVEREQTPGLPTVTRKLPR